MKSCRVSRVISSAIFCLKFDFFITADDPNKVHKYMSRQEGNKDSRLSMTHDKVLTFRLRLLFRRILVKLLLHEQTLCLTGLFVLIVLSFFFSL